MNDTQEHYVDILQNLIAVCRDGQKGYQDAAAHVQAHELKAFFNEQGLLRAQFAGQLEQESQRLGEHDPKRDGSVSGALHRAWFDLKAKLGGGDHAVLESVEAGEDRAKDAYEKAVTADLPENLRKTVQQQYQQVLTAHDRVRSLRDHFKAA